MEFIIHFEHRSAFPYYISDNYLQQGNILHKDFFISPQDAFEILNENGVDAFLKYVNGFFNFIFIKDDLLFAAVDCIRSIPLFYSITDNNFIISDNATWIKNQLNEKTFNLFAKKEFECTGYVTGDETLIAEIKQIQAGEYILVQQQVNKYSIKQNTYFNFFHLEPTDSYKKSDYLKDLDVAMDRCIENLIKYADGRQIVLPLSGGRDSRIIAIKLKEKYYENVICYTYGSENHFETIRSKQIAKALNFKWYFIRYTEELPEFLYKSTVGLEYFKMSHNFVSLPHLQDLYAVYELKQRLIVTENCLFVPGHSGDFVAGSHIPSITFCKRLNTKKLVDAIMEKHYVLSVRQSIADNKKLKNKILEKLNKKVVSKFDFANFYEEWDWRERQAKFIVNSVRVYDYFKVSWWLPFWDISFVNFWKKVPLSFRYEKKIYNEYVDFYSEKYNIPVDIPQKTFGYYFFRKIYLFRYLKKLFAFFASKLKFYNRYLLSIKRNRSLLKDFYSEKMLEKYCNDTNELNGMNVLLFFKYLSLLDL